MELDISTASRPAHSENMFGTASHLAVTSAALAGAASAGTEAPELGLVDTLGYSHNAFAFPLTEPPTALRLEMGI